MIGNNLIRITASEEAERRARTEAHEELFKALLDRARAGRYGRQMGQRFGGLDALTKAAAIAKELKLPHDRLDPLRNEAIACLALPDLKPAGRAIPLPARVIATAFDSTMTRYALRFRDGTIRVRRVADDHEVDRFQALGDRDIGVFSLSPDGRHLATTSGVLVVRDIDRHAFSLDGSNQSGPVAYRRVAKFTPDSRRFGVGHDNKQVVVYDLTTGQASWRHVLPAVPRDLAFRSDGTEIAVLYSEQAHSTCRILEARSGRVLRSIPLPATEETVAWSPDGSAIATTGPDSKISIWDAATGARRAALEGHTTQGLVAAFDPSGALLASNDWEGRLRIWDPVLGRPWLRISGYGNLYFSRDGRVVVSTEKLTPYEVNPALEYRTIVHAASPPLNYARVSVRRGGRLLALGTDRGVVLWDLARGTELAFMPIGLAWHTTFEPSGDLLTTGELGVWRWPFRIGTEGNEYHIGPPHQLPLPGGGCRIEHDQSGQIIALANHSEAYVIAPGRRFRMGPLEDCRGVAVSPNGEWLATGTHSSHGAQVWRIKDGTKVKELPVDYGTGVVFSPDGKWLMISENFPCRLWSVGTWEECAADRWLRPLFFPRRPHVARSRQGHDASPRRDRNGAHARAAGKSRSLQGRLCRLQPRRVTPRGQHQ